jgi:N6-adenosine-specific RNA methylase IME4
MMKVSVRLLRDAQEIRREKPEEAEAISRGEKTVTEVKRQLVKEEIIKRVVEKPSGKFRIFYADPPWKYGDTRNGLEGTTGAESHYPTMSIPELCALPIADLADENAVLFLWVTSPLLFECAPMIKAWGFTYKTSFVWDKVKHNMGHYNSVRHEFLLVCTRGSCTPEHVKLFDSVQSVERTEKHSEKPQEFRTIIDTLYPSGKRLELFAREKHNAWEVWGNQA